MLGKLLIVTFVSMLAASADAAGPPPSIDDIDGATFSVRAAGPDFDLNGTRSKFDLVIVSTITKTGPFTVSFGNLLPGMDVAAYYVDGFLLQAVSSGETPPESGSSMHVAVSGQPGNLKLKGGLTSFSAPPGGFQVLRLLKVSGSQLP